MVKNGERNLLLLTLAVITQPCLAGEPTFEGTLFVGSDFIYRGFSQNDRNPVLQFHGHWEQGSGPYFGIFTTNLEVSGVQDYELDTYAGYLWEGHHFDLDIGFLQSTLIETEEIDQFYIGLHHEDSSIIYWYSDHFDWHYIDVNHEQVFRNWSLLVHGGRWKIESSYTTDWLVGASIEYLDYKLTLAYTETNAKDDPYAAGMVTATISWSW